MKPHTSSETAFTLIEMLTVMAVIAILAGLIVSVNAYAHKKAALVRAEGEIRTMVASCESYKGDFGDFPRDLTGGSSSTDDLDPRVDGDPTKEKYQKASLALYKALSGDENANGRANGKQYFEFRPDQLQKVSTGDIKFIKDPFGNSYGYSTAAAKDEQTFREQLKKNPSANRPTGTALRGFNPTYDLWSTGGVISKTAAGGNPNALNAERKRWVKNW